MEYKQITLTEIYIPICFYFNTIRFFTCIICVKIGIPICFYFNAKSFVKSSYVLLFTFQWKSFILNISKWMTNQMTGRECGRAVLNSGCSEFRLFPGGADAYETQCNKPSLSLCLFKQTKISSKAYARVTVGCFGC